MRHKIHDAHPNRSALFDLKHDAGGMIDIEFISHKVKLIPVITSLCCSFFLIALYINLSLI